MNHLYDEPAEPPATLAGILAMWAACVMFCLLFGAIAIGRRVLGRRKGPSHG